MEDETADKKEKSGCSEFGKCLEILNLMLDNEATKDQEKYLTSHIEKCIVCFQQYEVEKEIRVLIKTKIKNQPVPQDLASNIRSKVFERA